MVCVLSKQCHWVTHGSLALWAAEHTAVLLHVASWYKTLCPLFAAVQSVFFVLENLLQYVKKYLEVGFLLLTQQTSAALWFS